MASWTMSWSGELAMDAERRLTLSRGWTQFHQTVIHVILPFCSGSLTLGSKNELAYP